MRKYRRKPHPANPTKLWQFRKKFLDNTFNSNSINFSQRSSCMNKSIFNTAVAVAATAVFYIGCGGSSTGGSGDNAEPVKTHAKPVTHHVKQAAKTEQTYVITFDANGGTVSPATGTTGTDLKLASLPTPTKTDNVFNGWYTTEAGDTAVTTSTVFSANTTVYAQWKEGFTDSRDGKTYRKVTIGTQTWMGQNLDYDVPDDTTDVCYDGNTYDNIPGDCTKYGRLYTWDVAKMACPVNWHLPSDAEWTTLVEYIGDDSTAGKKLKSTVGWSVDKYSGEDKYNGTDDYGFSALPGGSDDGNGFRNAGYGGIWWSATKRSNNGDAWSRVTGHYYDRNRVMGEYTENVVRYYDDRTMKFSVRCVMDGDETFTDTLTFTDSRDNKVYKKVKIGTQTWMAENLKYKGDAASGAGWGWRSNCYGNDSSNCEKYGSLYTWNNAMKACPADWHLPSDAEWTTLIDYAGGLKIAGGKLKSKTGWKNNGNGTDDYGFSALPGGFGYSGNFSDDGTYFDIGELGYWRSATKANSSSGLLLLMGYKNGNAVWSTHVASLFSVRCVQD
jgi:uncharacterized protein (TIGR02145 family)/uncharacterized repeat protein (TIGR02543 family)